MRRPWWQRHPCDPGSVNELLKGGALFPVPIMDQILPGSQEAPFLHGHMAGHLDHPRLSGMGCHPGDMHFPAAQMDEKEDVITNGVSLLQTRQLH